MIKVTATELARVHLMTASGEFRFIRIARSSDTVVSNAIHGLLALRQGQIGSANASRAFCGPRGHQPYCRKGVEQ